MPLLIFLRILELEQEYSAHPYVNCRILGVARLSFGSASMKTTLALIKKVADELSKKGTFNIILDTLTLLVDSAMAYKIAIGLNR